MITILFSRSQQSLCAPRNKLPPTGHLSPSEYRVPRFVVYVEIIKKRGEKVVERISNSKICCVTYRQFFGYGTYSWICTETDHDEALTFRNHYESVAKRMMETEKGGER